MPLACSPIPSSAAPITGAHEACDDVEFSHHMAVTRIADAGRPGRPYHDHDWEAILACGDAVDQRLQADDVRLTVGGEPTFVASRDPDADEWNTAALGPTKAGFGDRLLRRLTAQWGSGAVLHHGQGKWYPGEPLPRWAFSAYWRKDGEALWNNPQLFADPQETGSATYADAAALLNDIAMELGIDSDHTFAAYEDAWYYSWRERRLPSNVDPLQVTAGRRTRTSALNQSVSSRLRSGCRLSLTPALSRASRRMD